MATEKLTKGEITRRRIISESIRCFSRFGLEGGSVSELSRTAGVNRGLITHYFKTKENLIAECLLHVSTHTRALTQQWMQEQEASIADPIERYVRATFLWVTTLPNEAAFLMLCIQRTAYEPETRARVAAIFDVAVQGIQLMIEGGVAKNLYPRPADIGEKARQLHAAILGSIVLARVSAANPGPRYVERSVDAIRLLLGARPS